MKKKKVAIFIFDNVEVLDFAGPFEVFSSVRLSKKIYSNILDLPKPIKVFTVSEQNSHIQATGGLHIKSNYTINKSPKPDILIIPGGMGTRKLLNNQKVINWILEHKKIELLCSVCTGSLLLAKAGLLKKKKATTHWGAFSILKQISPTTKIITNQRFVKDTYITSAGVSAGIDMSLYIVEQLYGKTIAKNTSRYMDYKFQY